MLAACCGSRAWSVAVTSVPYLYGWLSARPGHGLHGAHVRRAGPRAVLVVGHGLAPRAVHQQHDDARAESAGLHEPDDVGAGARADACSVSPSRRCSRSGGWSRRSRSWRRCVAFLRAMVPDPQHRRTALWLSLAGVGVRLGSRGREDRRAAFRTCRSPSTCTPSSPTRSGACSRTRTCRWRKALLLFSLLLVWRAHRRPTVPAFLLAGLASLALALVHAYDLIILYAVVAAFGVVLLVRDRRLPFGLIGGGATALLFSAPMALYFQGLTAGRPALAIDPRAVLERGRLDATARPSRRADGPAAAAGGRRPCSAAGREPTRRCSCRSWAVVGLGLIYLPVVFQIKMLGGWQFPLAILAARTWQDQVVPVISRRLHLLRVADRAPALAQILLVLLVIPTNLVSLRVALRRSRAPEPAVPTCTRTKRRRSTGWRQTRRRTMSCSRQRSSASSCRTTGRPARTSRTGR